MNIFKRNIFITITIILSIVIISSFSFNNIDIKHFDEISLKSNKNNSYVEFFVSELKSNNKYPSENLFDGYLKTCMVVGNSVKTNSIYIKIPNDISINELILNIFSGYGKSKKLYSANSRPKTIRISIFSAFTTEGYVSENSTKYLIKKYQNDKIFQLSDTFSVQHLKLNFDENKLKSFQEKNLKDCENLLGKISSKIKTAFLIRLEILDIYKGNKYDDVCISELFFNNRFVSAYPNYYNQIDSVYIEKNTVFADYANEKHKIILQKEKKEIILIMIDWIKYSNWAILHFAYNDAVGNGRVAEQYALIDLKNKKDVTSEFLQSTNGTPFLLNKNNKGQIFVDIYKDYNVELK